MYYRIQTTKPQQFINITSTVAQAVKKRCTGRYRSNTCAPYNGRSYN